MKTNILVSRTIIQRSGFIRTAFTSLLQLVSIIHFNWAKINIKLTVIPNHYFVSGIAGSFTSTYNGEYVGFMNHFYDTNACTELSWKLLCKFISKFENFEPFLGTDWKVRLILIERNVQYFLFVFLHLYLQIYKNQ